MVGLNLDSVVRLVLDIIAAASNSCRNAIVVLLDLLSMGLLRTEAALVLEPQSALETEDHAYNKEESDDTSDNYTCDSTPGEALFFLFGGLGPVAQVRSLNGKGGVQHGVCKTEHPERELLFKVNLVGNEALTSHAAFSILSTNSRDICVLGTLGKVLCVE